MLAMIQGRSLERWQLVACIVVGVAALAVLVRHERDAEAPMLPLRLWSNRIIQLGNFGSFGIGATDDGRRRSSCRPTSRARWAAAPS